MAGSAAQRLRFTGGVGGRRFGGTVLNCFFIDKIWGEKFAPSLLGVPLRRRSTGSKLLGRGRAPNSLPP